LKGHDSGGPLIYKYAVSSQGRLIKFNKHLPDGFLLKLSRQEGFPIWRKRMNGKHYAVLLHRLVAKHFLPKPTGKQKFIMHLDFDKENNHYRNLKWATQEEVTKHAKKNPTVIQALKKRLKNLDGGYNTKLNPVKVKQIKSFLKQGKTLKELANKYKVSDMQIHRIRTGENWSHIK
jgi:hypothetical protein